MDLGYGPLSATKLRSLVNSGEVEEYYENGVQKFRKKASNPFAPNASKTNNYNSVVRKQPTITTRPGAKGKF
jgi:hypothetical protein